MMRFSEPTNTIGLCDALDGDEYLEGLEEVFQIEILPGEAEKLYDIGDVEDLIAAKLPRDATTSCLLSAMFRELAPELPSGTKPSALLTDLSGDDLAGFCRALSQKTGLTLDPDIRLRSITYIRPELWIILPFLALCSWAVLAASWFWVALGIIYVVLSLWLADEVVDALPHKKEPPLYLRTLGDLIRANLLHNYRDQMQTGSIANFGDQRAIIGAIGRQMTGYEGPIRRDTKLF